MDPVLLAMVLLVSLLLALGDVMPWRLTMFVYLCLVVITAMRVG
jgi:hypothetical protein